MLNTETEIATQLNLWALPVGIIFLTWIAAKLLKRLLNRNTNEAFKPLIPAAANIVYLIGMRMLVAAAPLSPKIALWAEDAVFVLVTILVLSIVRRMIVFVVEWSALRTSQSPVLTNGFLPLVRNLITLFIFFVGIIMIMKRFNYDVVSLLTALGVGSLAIGLAAKDTLSNMISGFTLIIDGNVRPGDQIYLAGTMGRVEEIGLRSTRILTGEGNILIVPNSELVNTRIINLSKPSPSIHVSLTFRVPVAFSFRLVNTVCQEVIGKLKKIDLERGSTVCLMNLTDPAQVIEIGFWINHVDQKAAAISECNEKLMLAFQEKNIPLADPMGVASLLAPK